MSDEKTPDSVEKKAPPSDEAKAKADAKPQGDAKPKKEKPPAVEDKPFVKFMQEDYLPALKQGLEAEGIADVALSLEKAAIAVKGFDQSAQCWQVVGRWNTGYKQPRQFNIYFFDEDINGKKGFSYSETNTQASTLESFRIDERKSDLKLLVFWTLQRLNAQKWLVRN